MEIDSLSKVHLHCLNFLVGEGCPIHVNITVLTGIHGHDMHILTYH